MRRLFIVSILAATVLASGAVSATAAPPTFQAAQRECEARGGEFRIQTAAFYTCFRNETVDDTAARAICENAHQGTFFVLPEGDGIPSGYACLGAVTGHDR